MTDLIEVNEALAELLAGVVSDVAVYAVLPEVTTPPLIVIGPGDPWVEFEGAPFGRCRPRLAVTFIADRGTNDVRVGEVTDAVVAIMRAVNDSDDFMVVQVDQPGQVVLNGQAHLGASVLVLTEVDV